MAKQKVFAPYTVKEKKKDKKIDDLDIFQKALLDAIKQQDQKLEEPPKPVKWLNPLKESIKPLGEQKDSSLARLAFTLSPGLRIQVNQSLARTDSKYKDIVQLLKSKDEKDYISGLDESRTGIESGSHNIGTSVGRLLFAGTDLVANTDFLEKFDDLMERTNPEDPETWRGGLVEILTTFGVPGTLVTKIGARVGKVGQISKVASKMNKHKASKIALRAIKGSGVVG